MSTSDNQSATEKIERALDVQESLDYEDSTPVGDGDITPLEFKSRETFNRFSRDIYKGKDAAVREPATNSITAVVQAMRLYGISNPLVEITLSYDSAEEEIFLTIRDNGVGISEYVLDNAMGVVGASTSADDGDVAGMWGMGFFATYMLTGPNGGFPMFTHSREEGEDPINVVWREYGARERIGSDPNQFGEDEYGTEFVIPVRPDIKVSELRGWVYKHCEWARVPVLYEEYCDGRQTEYSEEFGNRKFEDDYSETAPVLKFENEYMEIVASPDAQGRIVVLDSPANGKTYGLNLHDDDWGVDVRLYDESGVICAGPNKGLTPVEQDIWETMPKDRRGNYILESDMESDDISLPKLTGTRDEVAKNKPYWRLVSELVNDLYDEYVAEIFAQVHAREDFFNLETREQALLMSQIDTKGTKSPSDVKRICSDRFDRELDTELAEELYLLRRTVKKVERFSTIGIGLKTDSNPTKVWKVLATIGDGTVYMGKILNQDKCNVIWHDNEDNIVVQLNKDQTYDIFADPLGWPLAKSVTSKTIEEFDVPENVKEEFRLAKSSSSGAYRRVGERDIPDRELTVHKSSYGNTRKPDAGELRLQALMIERGERETFEFGPSVLVLFPTSTDLKISEHKHLVSRHVALASTTNQIADYIGDNVGCVMGIEEYLDRASEIRIPSSLGEMTIEEASRWNRKLLLHIMEDEYVDVLRDEGLLHAAGEWVGSNTSFRQTFSELSDENGELVFMPIKNSELARVQPVVRTLLGIDTDDPVDTRTIWVNRGTGGHPRLNDISMKRVNADADMYAAIRLSEWEGAQEYATLTTTEDSLTGSHIDLVDFYAELHDLGLPPASGELDELYAPEITVLTNKGEYRLEDAESIPGTQLVFHVLPPETVELFKDSEVIEEAAKFVADNVSRTRRSSPFLDSDTEMVYAPVTRREFESIKPLLEGSSHTVVGDLNPVSATMKGTIESDTAAYAFVRLPEYRGSAVVQEVLRRKPRLAKDGHALVETLAELHDAGVPVPK